MTRYDVSVWWLTLSDNFRFFLILSTQRYFYEIRDDRFRFRFHVVVHARLRWQSWWRKNGLKKSLLLQKIKRNQPCLREEINPSALSPNPS